MSPPVKTFPAKDLPLAAQVGVNGKLRRTTTEDGQRRPIDLAKDCELLRGMVQYECLVMQPEVAHSPIQCWPVRRLFRRCQDRNGTFMVETTAWEGAEAAAVSTGTAGGGQVG